MLPSSFPISPFALKTIVLLGALGALAGCGSGPRGAAQSQSPGTGRSQEGATAVDVAIARPAQLRQPVEHTGTTQPLREVSLRSQVEGRLLQLTVDVGDRVQQGQTLAQVDDAILVAAVVATEAELASRQSEIARIQTQVTEAKTRVEQARLQLQQAEADAARLTQLATVGAITQQQAEQQRTAAKTAAQVLRSAQEQVRNQQQAIAAAQGRVTAQQALVAQTKERLSFAVLNAPIPGSVTERIMEVGNLVQSGSEILKLSDFSQVKVRVQISELELAKVRLGGTATVRLDALPNKSLSGKVARISPAADPTSRLIPVEVTIPNSTGQIGSGLLARVSFAQQVVSKVIVPLNALQEERQRKSGGEIEGKSRQPSQSRQSPSGSAKIQDKPRKTEGVLFVVTGKGQQAKVQARSVRLGEQVDGKVEVLSGLKPGERFVARSSRPLKDGEPVGLSILSEK
jgi:multidrug efflux pump subunit AcrA (membrane-fusion protein)